VNLTAAALVAGGIALLGLAVISWRAWKAGKPSPLSIFGGVEEPRTETNRIAFGFELFFELFSALIMIGVGLAMLSSPAGA